MTFSQLRSKIHLSKPIWFKDLEAEDLTLWSVSIPITEDNDDTPILLEHVPSSSKKRLGPATRLSKVFPEELPEVTVLQRPPPVRAPVPARPSTPQLKSIPKDLLEQELEVILNDIQLRPTTPSVDPMEVKAFQNEELGPFFKRTLPHGETARDIKLVMLGLELGKLARTSDGETLHSIVEDDIGKYSDRRVVAMVAPSGSGKTATVVDLASKHFVIYCVCCIPSPTISPGFKDPNFITLAEDIESMYRAVIHRNQGRSQDAKDIDFEVKALAGERVKLEFLSRLLFLQHLLDNNLALEPLQFFREQTTKGALTTGDLVYKLKEYDYNTIQAMLSKVQDKLQSILVSKRLGLVIALDEAQVAVTGILSEKLISPSALINRDALFDSKEPCDGINLVHSIWCITVIAGVQTHLENVVFLPKAYLDNDGFIKSLEKAMMAYVTTLARGFCVGSPAFDPEEFVVLRDEAAERRDFLHDLKTEMPKGTKWADEVIESIEETVINGGFDEARVEQWPEDKVLQRRYQKFEYGRQERGKADRLASWSYEKYRYYLHLCKGRSLVTGMKVTLPRKLDIDRNIDTDKYDFDTILLMENEINVAKKSMSEFKDSSAFRLSKESFKPKWAVKILRADLWKLIEDTNATKDGWEQQLHGVRSEPRPSLEVEAESPLLPPFVLLEEHTLQGSALPRQTISPLSSSIITSLPSNVPSKISVTSRRSQKSIKDFFPLTPAHGNSAMRALPLTAEINTHGRHPLVDISNDGKDSQIQSKFRRGFLTPLSATLSNMRATLVIIGTALSLQDADHVYSAIAKPTNFSRITEFPRFDEKDVIKIHSKLVDMSDCEIPPAKRHKLTGRARFSIDVVERLATRCSSQDSKQAILDDAVDKSIEHTINGLRIGVRTILESDKTNEAARLLSRMVLAYHLQDAKISFSSQLQSDFVAKALCRLQQHPDGVHLIMDEPLVVEAVEEAVEEGLKSSGKDPTFIEYMDQLNRLIENLGAKSATKGEALEMLVRRSLQRFNGIPVFQFQIDEINTASGFGYKGSGVTADLAFLTACPPCKMLVARSGTRPDGVWFFPDKRYAGSLAIKFYSNDVPQLTHKENETSSDIRACFLMTDGDKLNATLAATRHSYENAGTPSNVKGILRIHMEFPCVKGVKPVTHVRKDPTTRANDVMVYINCENIDSFFDESIKAYRNDMIKLKKLIKYVCGS
ncbi:hypothetical protein KI688_012412 [Linnemannia hyalina]|uniref:Uncharacterized protein n=1 Tax=Linnemannia hyalina TaxID=64524 RepID=A0A9P7XVZ7_9FUNG|nr:hypothetical protein KI688_012412 [Linnemannia hyalina]